MRMTYTSGFNLPKHGFEIYNKRPISNVTNQKLQVEKQKFSQSLPENVNQITSQNQTKSKLPQHTNQARYRAEHGKSSK